MDTKPKIISKGFVTEVARYFMAFLETDFRKRTQPKRNLTSRVNNGLTVGLYLDRYANLYRDLYKNFIGGFPKESISVAQEQYITHISERLISLLEQRIKQIDDDVITKTLNHITDDITQLRLDNQKDYDNYFETSIESIKQRITADVVIPVLTDIEKSLEAAGWNTESGLYQLEVDATEKLYSILSENVNQILEQYYAASDTKDKLKKEIQKLLDKNSVQNVLIDFFREFSASDAYNEIAQLNRNKDMLDKTELYIYFCEISVNKFSFPLFYVPITVEHDHPKIELNFDNRVFVNVKAIEFVLQQYNSSTNSNESVAGSFERILYYEDRKELLPALQSVVDQLLAVLDLSKAIDLKISTQQNSSNLIARVSNRLQLFLFDKSDEALINDYEEIIQDQGELTDAFAELIDSFITENPKSIIEDVAREWDDQSIPEKLIVDSPIALNEEQKQVMIALQKDDCKVAILEGPPGTGKSHTITAIVCKALLEGKSVLVLSDKEEALDVVQDKITDTLSTIRNDKNFQNPILRLGKSSRGLSKVIEGHALDKVREHMRAYRSQEADFGVAEEKTKSEAKKELNDVIDLAGKVDLNDVSQYLVSGSKFKNIYWLNNEYTEKAGDDLLSVHKAVLGIISSKVIELLPYLDSYQLDLIRKLKALIENYVKDRDSLSNDTASFVNGYKHLNQDEQISFYKSLSNLAEQKSETLNYLNNVNLTLLDKLSNKTQFEDIKTKFETLSKLYEVSKAINLYLNNSEAILPMLEQAVNYEVGAEDLVDAFKMYIEKLQALKSRVMGYSGKRGQIDELTRELKRKIAYFNFDNPEKLIPELILFTDTLEFCLAKLRQYDIPENLWVDAFRFSFDKDEINTHVKKELGKLNTLSKYDFMFPYKLSQVELLIANITAFKHVKEIQELCTSNPFLLEFIGTNDIAKLISKQLDFTQKLEVINNSELIDVLESQVTTVNKYILDYPNSADTLKLGTSLLAIRNVDEDFINSTEDDLKNYLNFRNKQGILVDEFTQLSRDDFTESTESLQLLNAAKMANILDSRIIDYVDNHQSDIRTLKNMLKAKQKFPRVLFSDLRQAFPCILAGIRDYATYIPIEKDLFDLVIIDEASQVSIAQALPALIRGKKVLVLGDDKQFSNVKAGNASILTNNKYRNGLLGSLREAIDVSKSDYTSVYTSKVNDNFNVKKSILDFCRFITNYQTMLKKHFRCYPEIIAYSDEKFYDHQLQCMKARALPISEVIKFSYIKDDGKSDQYINTNSSEANFVLEQFMALKEKEYNGTIGVITPHREQATLINNLLNESEISDWLKEHKLKVMTFDTCQGEERDYILYSMVATENNDKHYTLFPVSMETSKREGKEFGTREQRLNVGFSRAKETIHFVLSKPIEEYWGEIKIALKFYENKLNTTSYIIGGTDKNSEMEENIQHYFYQTKFFEKYGDELELIPQFPIGQYLKTLNRNYNHPNYKVDFLLTFNGQKVVIEYDGFKEHFLDGENINSQNFMSYLKPDDIYRQKVLEGYGYKFLRLNKFNLTKDPVSAINELLEQTVKKKPQLAEQLIHI